MCGGIFGGAPSLCDRGSCSVGGTVSACGIGSRLCALRSVGAGLPGCDPERGQVGQMRMISLGLRSFLV